jgi:hypothetical protein
MRVRLFALCILALVLSIIFFASPAIHNRTSMSLVCLFPPGGLELPAGQGIEIRCYSQAESPATIEFLVDGVRIHAKKVQPGGVVAMGWIPEQVGSHILATIVRMGSRQVTTATCQVLVVSSGSPVRVPQE